MNTSSRLSKRCLRTVFGVPWIALALAISGCNRSEQGSANQAADSKAADAVGRRIEFREGGDSEPYRAAGWSKTEAQFTWSEGTSAKLALPISASPGGLNLKLTMAALIHEPELPFQPVEVYANGQKIAEWQVGNTAEFVVALPTEMTKSGGTLLIEFRTPKATSPKSLGLNQDPRILGICVHRLELARL